MGKFLHVVGKQLWYIILFLSAGEILIYVVASYFGSLNNHAKYEEWGGIWFISSVYFFIYFFPAGILYAIIRGFIAIVKNAKSVTPNAAPDSYIEDHK